MKGHGSYPGRVDDIDHNSDVPSVGTVVDVDHSADLEESLEDLAGVSRMTGVSLTPMLVESLYLFDCFNYNVYEI